MSCTINGSVDTEAGTGTEIQVGLHDRLGNPRFARALSSPRHYAKLGGNASGMTRSYCGQRVEVSPSGLFEGEQRVIWNGLPGHTETARGNQLQFDPVVGRYIRHYSAGSTVNPYVHFVEIRVAG